MPKYLVSQLVERWIIVDAEDERSALEEAEMEQDWEEEADPLYAEEYEEESE